MPQSFRTVLLWFGVLYLARPCHAHDTGLSTTDLKFGTNSLNAEIVFAKADMALALSHLLPSPPDIKRDGAVGPEELTSALERVRKAAEECLVVEFDGRTLRPTPPRFVLDEKDNFHLELTYPGDRPGDLRIRFAWFEHLPATHMHFLTVHDVDETPLGNKMLKPGDNTLALTLPAPGLRREGSPKVQPRVSTFTDFLKLGVEHIWTGYDHILFLLALLIVCRDFKSALQVVTFFTVAHSITLAFATLNLVSVSSRVTEPAIAASIVYVGVENFVRREGPKGRWLITFLFGLIHGLGFASVLRDLGVASSTTGVAVPLVAFNLGVEMGQIVIAAILLPIIWKLQSWKAFLQWGVPACSAAVTAAGGYWLVQRVFFV